MSAAGSPPDNPHDTLVRALLSNAGDAATLLREHLPPEIAARLSGTPPVLLDGSFVDPHLRLSTSDRLFGVALRGGRPALLYVLIEHKSAPDRATPLQLLRYMVRIWERHLRSHPDQIGRLPPILPLVLYHGRPPWRVPTAVIDCLDLDDALRPLVQDFRYTVRDLGRLPPEALSAVPHIRAVLMALRLGTGEPARLERLVEIVAALPDESLLEAQVVRYIVAMIGSLTPRDWHRVAALAKPQREEAMVSLAAQEWIAQGRETGFAQGRQEGRQEGRIAVLLAVLEARFGPLDAGLRRRLAGLTPAEVDALVPRAATAAHLDDVFDPPATG
ncbi:Rpn family recombination-promoting nuclease/putative transposase [Roseospira goensis]|uniref:Putative transposase YdaD n=1 Tax=Roseospira goensis TaxID=391922 RepID=A0A7W6RWM6_9PROT|nr:Rpn family recombination-promoting nuclease/putative transposase [Roseospira goensis]MBB4284603.1 putative transposase YdaD [Roseospira goensis]